MTWFIRHGKANTKKLHTEFDSFQYCFYGQHNFLLFDWAYFSAHCLRYIAYRRYPLKTLARWMARIYYVCWQSFLSLHSFLQIVRIWSDFRQYGLDKPFALFLFHCALQQPKALFHLPPALVALYIFITLVLMYAVNNIDRKNKKKTLWKTVVLSKVLPKEIAKVCWFRPNHLNSISV